MTRDDHDLPPDSSSQRREVIVMANPVAGSQCNRRHVQELVNALRARELTATLCTDREELSELVRSRPDGIRCVVAAGGDGTLNEVLNRAAGLPVAILPLGNQNLMARHFRVGRSGARLAQAIASAPVRHLDLARARDRYFSLVAGIGLDAQVVHDVHRDRRGKISLLAYVLPVIRTVCSYRFPSVEVEIDETGERLQGAMALLFNMPVYGLGLPIGVKARPDDGWLDLFVFQRPGLVHLARYLGAVLWRCHEQLSDVQYRRVKRARLSSDSPVPVQIDGDPAGTLPLTVEVAPAALRLLMPTPPNPDTCLLPC